MNTKVVEDFITLALNPKTGYYRVSGNYLTYGVLGALLMDLALAEKLILDGKNLISKRGSITGLPVYDKVIDTISASSKARSIRYWLRKLLFKATWYRKEVQKLLSNNGVLRHERKRFIGIPYSIYFPGDQSRTTRLALRLKDIVVYNKEPNEQEVMILGLIYACRMHRVLTNPGFERREFRKSLVKYIKDNPYAAGVSKTIMEMNAALTASISAAVIASSVSSGSR